MKIYHWILLVVGLIIGQSSAVAQYKYDVGLRISTYELERFQLDGRYHFKSPYSILVSLTSGWYMDSERHEGQIHEDSLIYYSSTRVNESSNSLNIGVQRKLGLFETDMFYGGATIGLGYKKYSGWHSSGVYQIDSTQMNPSPVNFTSEVYSSETISSTRTLSAQLTLSIGMDVPLSERLYLNVELGLISAYRSLMNSSSSFFEQYMSFSGGLRYSFGKRA